MKEDIHPKYRQIIFVDQQTGHQFLIGSTLTDQQIKGQKGIYEADGKEYPLYRAPMTSKSHPFFIGSSQAVDTAGRMKHFADKYAKKTEALKKSLEAQEEKSKEIAKAKKKKK
jgi:large subunit ribosomal protein L31